MIKILITLLILTSCAGLHNKKSKNISEDIIKTRGPEDRPEWVDTPEKGCQNSEICAVGESTGKILASTNARSELSKFFQVKINSNTKITTDSHSTKNMDGILSANSTESLSSQIEESTNDILEGVTIREFYFDGSNYLALAVLDKKMATKVLQEKLDHLNSEIFEKFQSNTRSGINKSYKLAKLRDNLNQKYLLMTGNSYPSLISIGKILSAKRAKKNKNTSLSIIYEEEKNPQVLKSTIKSLFIENGFKIISQPKKSQYSVKIKFSTKSEYIKVEGFERYLFNLDIEATDLDGVKVGSLTFSTTETGRDYNQCFESSWRSIKTYLDNHLDEIEMD